GGLLDQTPDEYPVLKLNDESWQVLRGQKEVRLTRSGAATASRRSRAEETSWDGVDSRVFDALRAWRREAAAAKGVPPYTIFHDATLRDISRVRPTRPDVLHLISGVGEAKLRDYAPAVLGLVARLSQENALTTNNPLEANAASSAAIPRASVSAAEGAFPHFRNGKSITEVAQMLGRAESTVREYLCVFIHEVNPERIDVWVDRATQERVASASRVHGSQRLKPIFLALKQEVPYDAIRIVLTHLNVRADFTPRDPRDPENAETGGGGGAG